MMSASGNVIGNSSCPASAAKYSGEHSRNSAAVITTCPYCNCERILSTGIVTNCSGLAGTLWLMAWGRVAAMAANPTRTTAPFAAASSVDSLGLGAKLAGVEVTTAATGAWEGTTGTLSFGGGSGARTRGADTG